MSRKWPYNKVNGQGCVFEGSGSLGVTENRVSPWAGRAGQEGQNGLSKGVGTGTALMDVSEIDRKMKSVAEKAKTWKQRARGI